ncbi:MAG: ribulose-phosphate 3-epimerase, partial [Candidatus Binatia bacterium]
PEAHIPDFAAAGADQIAIHPRACADFGAAIRLIRSQGRKVSGAVNPEEPLSILEGYWDELDTLLLMSVNPGKGGQGFIESVMEKISAASALKTRGGYRFQVEVDGGVKSHNAARIAAAGADVLVAGSAVFESDDYGAAISAIRGRS